MKNKLLNYIQIKNLSEKILIFYFAINLINLLLILFNSFGKTILYEDSFLLLKPNNYNFIDWGLRTHNGHIIFITKIISALFNKLSLSPSGYNISISVLILLIGLIVINKIINKIYQNGKYKKIIFLLCSYFWISPWQWENIIWEFQIPWFLVSLLVLLLTLSNLYDDKYAENHNRLINNLFLTLSPLTAILCSGQGICYLNCVLISLIYRNKKNIFPWISLILAYLIYVLVRLNYERDLNISINILRNFIYIITSLFTIFKPSISSFNNYSYHNWILPLFSSLILQIFLVKLSFFKIFNLIKSSFSNIKIFTPLIFAMQFLILASLTRSNYGFYQGAVSRYHTYLILVPVGLIFIIINNKIYLKNLIKFEIIEKQIWRLSIIFVILILINSSSLFRTIYETQIAYKTRLDNFNIFVDTCKINKNLPNKRLLIINNFKKLKEYHGVNFPPQKNANKIEVFESYINSDLCNNINFHFQ